MKGYIYSICSHQSKDIYIGSTEQELSTRLSWHMRDYNMWIKINKQYCTSYEIIKYGDAYIELIIEVDVEDTSKLRKIEGEYQLKMECVNKNIAGRTYKEWYETNKEYISKYHKLYYTDNCDKILDYQKKYRDENIEKIKNRAKKYRDTHCEQIKNEQNKYYQDNAEQRRNYQKKYNQDNIERVCNYQKKYNQENAEMISSRRKEKMICECGSICNKSNISTHIKSKKHINFIK